MSPWPCQEFQNDHQYIDISIDQRIWKVSNLLMEKLNALPKENEHVFNNRLRQSVFRNFAIQRRRIAAKLGNPRLQRITFRTFRHWKATMEYYRTRDIPHTMDFLGHKNIKNTLIYTQLVKFQESNDFYSSVAKTAEEAKKLIESGFDYVCTTPENIMVFRKRKYHGKVLQYMPKIIQKGYISLLLL